MISCAQTKPELIYYGLSNYAVLDGHDWLYGLRLQLDIVDKDKQLNQESFMMMHEEQQLSWQLGHALSYALGSIAYIDAIILVDPSEDITGLLSIQWRENFGFQQNIDFINTYDPIDIKQINWQELSWSKVETKEAAYHYAFHEEMNVHFMIELQHPEVARYVTYTQHQ